MPAAFPTLLMTFCSIKNISKMDHCICVQYTSMVTHKAQQKWFDIFTLFQILMEQKWYYLKNALKRKQTIMHILYYWLLKKYSFLWFLSSICLEQAHRFWHGSHIFIFFPTLAVLSVFSFMNVSFAVFPFCVFYLFQS